MWRLKALTANNGQLCITPAWGQKKNGPIIKEIHVRQKAWAMHSRSNTLKERAMTLEFQHSSHLRTKLSQENPHLHEPCTHVANSLHIFAKEELTWTHPCITHAAAYVQTSHEKWSQINSASSYKPVLNHSGHLRHIYAAVPINQPATKAPTGPCREGDTPNYSQGKLKH